MGNIIYDTEYFTCKKCGKTFEDLNDRWRLIHLESIVERIVCKNCYDKRNQEEEWLPSPENINALPEPIRIYIHDLETQCDPAGMVAENVLLRDQLKSLTAKFKEVIRNDGVKL